MYYGNNSTKLHNPIQPVTTRNWWRANAHHQNWTPHTFLQRNQRNSCSRTISMFH